MAGRVHTFRANFTALVVALVWSKLVESQEREYPAQVNVVSPLHEGVYQADVKIVIIAEVSGLYPELHSSCKLQVYMQVDGAGGREIIVFNLADEKDWTSRGGTAHFKSAIVDVPNGHHSLEFRLLDPAGPSGEGTVLTTTVTPFQVLELPVFRDSDPLPLSECTLLIDASRGSPGVQRDRIQGFVEGNNSEPRPFTELGERRCLMYKVKDVRQHRHGADARQNNKHKTAALLLGVGPIDAPAEGKSLRALGFAAPLLGPLLLNRFCFALREGMDLLFVVATAAVLHGRSADFVRVLGIRSALRSYQAVVWTDLEGMTPFAPRWSARSCVPFTSCWPVTVQAVLLLHPAPPFAPSSDAMLFRRGRKADDLLAALWAWPTAAHHGGLAAAMSDALLTQLARHSNSTNPLRYAGQCRRPGDQGRCWEQLLGGGDEAALQSTAIPGVLLSTWCSEEGEDAASRVVLTCPCAPPSLDRHCVEFQHPFDSRRVLSALDLLCMDTEVLFVNFGDAFRARSHELSNSNEWSCSSLNLDAPPDAEPPEPRAVGEQQARKTAQREEESAQEGGQEEAAGGAEEGRREGEERREGEVCHAVDGAPPG